MQHFPPFLIGMITAVVVLLPVVRMLLRREGHRRHTADERARTSERLAELGTMTGGLAHEIKNPLSTIGLNAQLLGESLRDTDLPPDRKSRLLRRLESLASEVERLRGILTDFLQFAGRMKLDAMPHDLGVLVSELVDFYHPQCDQEGVVMRATIPETPVMVTVDEGLVKQALLNLMLNAVQTMRRSLEENHTHDTAGELMIAVELDPRGAVVHVTDTGQGIDPDRLESIFHPYESGHPGGSGLGLATARRIVEEHHGQLSVQSVPGQGSSFSLFLPHAGPDTP